MSWQPACGLRPSAQPPAVGLAYNPVSRRLYAALDNCDEALEHIQAAIELDPDRKYLQEQLVRFEKAAEEKKKG